MKFRKLFRREEKPSDSDSFEGSPIGTNEEALLENHGEVDRKILGGGANRVLIVELEDDVSAIFKPKAGEFAVIPDIERGTYFLRERAAYIVDRFLGFNLVPTTVIRQLDEDVGSMQKFIPNALTPYEIAANELKGRMPSVRPEMIKLWILDYIIMNTDRHWENLLIDVESGKVHAIDNGLSFRESGVATEYQYFEEQIPPEIFEQLEKFMAWDEGRELCEELVAELVGADAAEACMERIREVTDIIRGEGMISRGELSQYEYHHKSR